MSETINLQAKLWKGEEAGVSRQFQIARSQGSGVWNAGTEQVFHPMLLHVLDLSMGSTALCVHLPTMNR